jgi:hypothetical protein
MFRAGLLLNILRCLRRIAVALEERNEMDRQALPPRRPKIAEVFTASAEVRNEEWEDRWPPPKSE